jgi:uncharacterized damage-inducible protein DinB
LAALLISVAGETPALPASKNMVPVDTLRVLYDYNYWARDRQLEACAALTEEQFLRPMGNSFSSVRDTLAHLVAAEWVWLERWLGRSPTKIDGEEYSAKTFPTLGTVRERWRTVESKSLVLIRSAGFSA